MHSDFEYENLMQYKVKEYRQEAEAYRLAKLAEQGQGRPDATSYKQILDQVGTFLISIGRELQRRAGRCLPPEELIGLAH